MTEPNRNGETGKHAAPDGAARDRLIDMDRDPTPGVPDHAAPGDDADDE